MIRSALPSKQLAERRVITHHVKMPETACTTPVGTLNRNAALFKMLIEMASLKQLEEQGKTAKRGYLLVYELYVTISYQIL